MPRFSGAEILLDSSATTDIGIEQLYASVTMLE